MTRIVKKFGGTSLANVDCIHHVADLIQASTLAQSNDQIVIVVSAMSGETNRLIQLAQAIQTNPSDREYSVLVSTGEQVTSALLAMALEARGLSARSMTGRQAKILTESKFCSADILEIDPTPIETMLAQGKIVVVAGFQGYDTSGNITTLERGGSDLSAVALAAMLKAKECQIYTDVAGVYTADPRIVSNARRLNRITFEEMLEMSSLGTKVLQLAAVEFAGKYQVPIRVLSTFESDRGTLIEYTQKRSKEDLVSGVAFSRNESKITVFDIPDRPGIAYQILEPIREAGIDVDMIIQNISEAKRANFTFTVNRKNYPCALRILRSQLHELEASAVAGSERIAKLSIVGSGIQLHPGIANHMFEILSKEGINIQMIAISEIKVSVIVDEKYTELGIRSLHDGFNLSNCFKGK